MNGSEFDCCRSFTPLVTEEFMTFKLCYSPKAVEAESKTACITLTASYLANAQAGRLMGLLMVHHMLARQRIKKQKQNKGKNIW